MPNCEATSWRWDYIPKLCEVREELGQSSDKTTKPEGSESNIDRGGWD